VSSKTRKKLPHHKKPQPIARSLKTFAAEAHEAKSLTELVDAFSRNFPETGEDKERRQGLASMKELAEFVDSRDRLAASMNELHRHHEIYERLLADADAANRFGFELFGRPEFADLSFDPEQVERCFEQVGPLSSFRSGSEQFFLHLRKAVLAVATSEQRQLMATRLIMRLPERVERGQYQEAWMMLLCAQQTLETPKQLNPFLTQMFLAGAAALEKRKRLQEDEMLKAIGVDVKNVPPFGTPEFAAWMESLGRNREFVQRAEAFFTSRPEFRQQAQDLMEKAEAGALELLQRPDFQPLLLSLQEITPGLQILNRRTQKIRQELLQGKAMSGEMEGELGKIWAESAREFLPQVITPARRDRLIKDLQTYQYERRKSDPRAAELARDALMALQSVSNDHENRFLIAYVMVSLTAAPNASRE